MDITMIDEKPDLYHRGIDSIIMIKVNLCQLNIQYFFY